MHKNRERITLLLVLGIFAALIINLNLFSFQIDLTSTGVYTISPASKAVVAQAKEPIYLTYYLSKKLEAYYPVTQGISDFLHEYASATGGRIRVRIVDPKASGQLGDMRRLGIEGNQIQVTDQSQLTEEVVYSGIELSYLDRHEVLPVVDSLETLEYDLTSHLEKLITQKSTSVGFLIGDPSRSLDKDYKILERQLQTLGNFQQLPLDHPIPQSINALIVAGNAAIDDTTAYFIDQYLMNGGKVLMALDSVNVDISSNKPPVVLKNNPALKLIASYGVEEPQDLVLDSYNNIVQFNSQMGVVLQRYPEWPQILPQDTNSTNPVTAHFAGLSLMWPSPLTVIQKPGIKSEVLVTTSPKSWLMTKNFTIDPNEALMSSMGASVKKQKYPVVVALTGRFPSAYTAATIPKAQANADAAPFQSLSPETRLIVVGGSTWLTDLMKITQSQANALFASSAVDWLAQDDALLSIKTRSYRDHSLTGLQDNAERQAAAFSLSFVNIALIPLLVLVVGVIRFLRRRRRELKN